MRRLLVWLGIALGAFVGLLAVVAIAARFVGPIQQFPGGRLSGEPAAEPAGAWGPLLEGVRVIQLEVNPADPYSVNTSYVLHGGQLYLPSPWATRKRWTNLLLDEPRVVLRIRGELYERSAVRVADPAELRALYRKIHGPDAAREETSTWYFRVGPR